MTETVDTFSLTPDQATAQLAELSAQYRSKQPVDPHAQLEAKFADPEFRSKLDAGSPAAREEFDRMVAEAAAADPVKAAMTGRLPDIPDSGLRLMSNFAEFYREIGLSEGAIAQALGGDQEPREAYERVKQWRADRMSSDPEWVKRLLSGGTKERRDLILSSIVLAAGPKD